MHCPVDDTPLVMTERSGVEIDYCPKCRGVWLDRGELDKIIQQADSEHERYSRDDEDEHNPDEHSRDPRHDYRFNEHHEKPKKRRGSFLGDMFEGFGGD